MSALDKVCNHELIAAPTIEEQKQAAAELAQLREVNKQLSDALSVMTANHQAAQQQRDSAQQRITDLELRLQVVIHAAQAKKRKDEQRIAALEQSQLDHENDCAILPENVSVTEYVTVLQQRIAVLEAAGHQANSDLLEVLTEARNYIFTECDPQQATGMAGVLKDIDTALKRLAAHPTSEDDKLPTLGSLRGIAPNATGDLSSEEFVRRLRDW